MVSNTRVWYSVLSLATLLGSAHASCLHATSKLRRRVTEGQVAVSNFGYTNLQGPLNWASLAPENIQCSTGSVQSPINLGMFSSLLSREYGLVADLLKDSSVTAAAVAPVVEIPNVESAEFENLGTTVEVIVNGTTTLGGAQFSLKQFHFHTPSEHRINEEYFPLEMHMVHEATGS